MSVNERQRRIRPNNTRRWALHLSRLLLFVVVILLIHFQHARKVARASDASAQAIVQIPMERLRRFYPTAHSVSYASQGRGARRDVLDEAEAVLGYVLQTSPQCDHFIGFSGPTNALIAFSADDRIIGIDIVSSRDTREHVEQVVEDERFFRSFHDLTWDQVTTREPVDGVTGATLTSLAIQESIIHRLGGNRPSLRFPDPITVEIATRLFPSVDAVEQDAVHSSLWHVKAADDEIGTLLRSSPHADNLVGFQGPTETLIGFDVAGRVVGITLGKSYDNEPYVTYVRDEASFLNHFNEWVLDDLADLDSQHGSPNEPHGAKVEGVSGATMTSMAIVEGMCVAAEQHRRALIAAAQPQRTSFQWTLRDLGTALVILAGLVIGMTSLRGKKWVRVCFQLVLIGYLGLVNGDMLSQAMIVGWAQSGVPWTRAGGLVLLTVAAFLVPITSRRNIYCTHLCPHGAAQHLLKNRLPWRLRLPPWLTLLLKFVPGLLLAWCVIVAMTSLSYSLIDIEPFDAWVFRIAGWSTIVIAIVGLVASLFIPMAYCRYGCPTGALLNFLKLNARSDQISRRDWLAMALTALAFGIWIAS